MEKDIFIFNPRPQGKMSIARIYAQALNLPLTTREGLKKWDEDKNEWVLIACWRKP